MATWPRELLPKGYHTWGFRKAQRWRAKHANVLLAYQKLHNLGRYARREEE